MIYSNKKYFLFALVIFCLISCNKEQSLLLSKYQTIYGTWHLEYVTLDSSGIAVSKLLPYDRLVIKENLDYSICLDLINPVENGTINIVFQSTDKLEIYFAAKYPAYSSYAGSHLFGITNVRLVSVSDNEMVIKTINPGYGEYSDEEFYFVR